MNVQDNYLAPLQAARTLLQQGGTRVYMPQSLGLLQNRPGMHFHPYPELFLQISGRRLFTCPLESFQINDKEICIMPAQLPHKERAFDAKDLAFDGIVLWADRDDVLNIHRSVVRENGGRPGVGPSVRVRSAEVTAVSQLLVNVTAFDTPDIRDSLLYALLGLVCQVLRDHGHSHPAVAPEPSRALVESARAFIHAYLSDANLSVRKIASEAGCSADHLSRCFQRHLGLSVQSYLQSERLSLACRLLKKPNLRICEVAWACGFSSDNYFIRLFRKQTGKTPRDYRRG